MIVTLVPPQVSSIIVEVDTETHHYRMNNHTYKSGWVKVGSAGEYISGMINNYQWRQVPTLHPDLTLTEGL